MPDLTASIPHQLTRAEAKRRIQEQIASIRQRHGSLFSNLEETWADDRLQFTLATMGQSISGHLVVDDRMVHLTVALPWILRMFASTIKRQLEDEGRQILGRLGHETPGNKKDR